MQELKKSHLNELHLSLNAKFGNFANFKMPLWYKNVQSEHLAVRKNCGIFDVSHMLILIVSGANTKDQLNLISCNKISDSKQCYTMFLTKEGKIIDDIMISPLDRDRFLIVANAANSTKVLNWIRKQTSLKLQTLNKNHCLIAIQGPLSQKLCEKLLNENLNSMKKNDIRIIKDTKTKKIINRSGYTGEDGFELIVPNDEALILFEAAIKNGATACGLASRDSLRLEKGYPLYGQEINSDTTPLDCHYQWVVKTDKEFIGKKALMEHIITQQIIAFSLEKQIPRMGYPLYQNNKIIGKVTSGTFSPILKKGIGLARVLKDLDDKQIEIEIRKKRFFINLESLPFC